MFLCRKQRNLFTHAELPQSQKLQYVAATALKTSLSLAVLGGASAPFISPG